jgi:hypothetical protein
MRTPQNRPVQHPADTIIHPIDGAARYLTIGITPGERTPDDTVFL